MFDRQIWAAVPFHFWSMVFFTAGAMVGSFLNVCIHRMPRGESIISPPSHCPKCGYSIPWYLNVPLLTWLWLRGRCANCQTSISSRYFIVELVTGLLFLASWLVIGRSSASLAVVYCVLLAGFIAATFIDFEHFIIPDEITLGGIVAGFLLSALVPELHGDLLTGRAPSRATALLRSGLGILIGWGVVYAILRVGKLLFGRQRVQLAPDSRVIFTETALVLPDQSVPYDEIFYRNSDAIQFHARKIETIDRCYQEAEVRLTPSQLTLGEETFDPDQVPQMEAVTDQLTLPREAMGFGDVKFMGAIGAFIGWQGAVFSLMISAVIGAAVGLTLICLGKREWSSRIPYGPYIALAAAIWIFGGRNLAAWWFFVPR